MGLLIRRVAPILWCSMASFGQAPPATEYWDAAKKAQEMQTRGDPDGAIRTLTPWVEKYPDRAEGQHALGLAYYQQSNFAAAVPHLSAALKLEAENSAAWRQTVETLAMAYYFGNRWQDALPLLKQAVTWNPGDTYFRYALAMTYVYTRDLDAARKVFAQLFDIPPDGPQALVLTADFLIREKFTAEAEKLVLEAQKKRPDLPDINYRLAVIALTNGAASEAVAYLKKELAINPLHPMAWHYLGYSYVQLSELDPAVKCLQRAVWLNLRSTDSYVLLAQAYTHQGKYLEAEQALKRALELAPQNHEGHYLLARVYQKTNRPELAKKEMAVANKLRTDTGAKH